MGNLAKCSFFKSGDVQIVEQEVPAQNHSKCDLIGHIFVLDPGLSPEYYQAVIKYLDQVGSGDWVYISPTSDTKGQFFEITASYDIDKVTDFIESIQNDTCGEGYLKSWEELSSLFNDYTPSRLVSFVVISQNVPIGNTTDTSGCNQLSSGFIDKITQATVVWLGLDINEGLMSISDSIGGCFVCTKDSRILDSILSTLVEDTKKLGISKIHIEPSYEVLGDFICSMNGRQINTYKLISRAIPYVPPIKGKSAIYYLSKDQSIPSESMDMTPSKKLEYRSMLKGCYSLAYMLVQNRQIQTAMSLMSAIGEEQFVNDLANSCTYSEYCRVESNLRKAMYSTQYRFQKEYNPNCLPKDDAFCFFDLLDLLKKDPDAVYYPHVEKYNRIHAKSKALDGVPQFTPEPDPKNWINKVTWNLTKLNLSIPVRVNGTVDLGESASQYGFSRNYPTYVWRNYCWIKSGDYNMDTLWLSVGKDTHRVLADHGLIEDTLWLPGVKAGVDLSKLPVINRIRSKACITTEEIASMYLSHLEYQCDMKVLKYLLKLVDQPEKPEDKLLTLDQQEFLKANYIQSYGFTPPVQVSESLEKSYVAKEFAVKIHGCSSLPSIDSVLKKVSEGKKLTLSDTLINNAYNRYHDELMRHSFPTSVRVSFIKNWMDVVESEFAPTMDSIQILKFAVLLGKCRIEGLDLSNPVFEYDGYKFTVDIKTSHVVH